MHKRVTGYGLWVMGYGLWVMGYGFRICVNDRFNPTLVYFAARLVSHNG